MTNSNKSRAESEHVTISGFDVSESLGIIVTGGAVGRMLLVDPYAFGVLGSAVAHLMVPIINVFIYESQAQIISVGENRMIIVWEALTLQKLQVVHDVGNLLPSKFSACTFDAVTGTLWAGCQKVNRWKSKIDPRIEVDALQVTTLVEHNLKGRGLLELTKLKGSRKNLMQ
jgi:hypothetical protein